MTIYLSQLEGRAAIRRSSSRRSQVAFCFQAILVVIVTGCSNVKNADIPADLSAVKTFETADPWHVESPVEYPQSPPVSGNHSPGWQNCGFYEEPVRNEPAVHSMEHGAVWITFRPGLPASDIRTLRSKTANQPYLLVTPYLKLRKPVVATAWGHQLELEGVDDPRLALFVLAYQQGPQTPEPGAPCLGAIGEPQ